jgi:major vault protein
MADNQNQLVLAQNQHALVQDLTKGFVLVYVGPTNTPIGNNERPVVYDKARDTFTPVSLPDAVKQNPFVPEGHYLVLENPTVDAAPPKRGSSNPPAELLTGCKINVPGPTTFPLWPGQSAEVVQGHHLRSNQYLLVRVYNAEEANKTQASVPATLNGDHKAYTSGQQLIIKGTEVNFFIPPTGFEVLKDAPGNTPPSYVREALTLERLEYAILLDEDGNKRYEKGPQVVFPKATETFITREDEGKGGKSRKFKAIELNDYMGLYVKVTADYEEDVPEGTPGATLVDGDDTNSDIERSLRPRRYVRQYKTGEELFITGKEQRIYYQRAEHALIGYDDPGGGGFKRERYYGITIPKGEGRYVLDKLAGLIKTVKGPCIYLPDPRNEVIVRRVLDAKTVGLWYPGNAEAQAFNASLAGQASEDMGYLTYNAVSADVASRSMNRMTASNIGGDQFKRSGKFTPPPTLTLGSSTKYDGVPSIAVWTGYAVQVVNKSGDRRVVVGPANVLLEYDETLEMFELSTGKPKTTSLLKRDVYLRVDNNFVTDVVSVETKDLVEVAVKLSYKVSFLREHQDAWFSVENYVKYLCDNMRSRLKGALKRRSITEVMDDSSSLIRDIVLGTQRDSAVEVVGAAESKQPRKRLFSENGLEVYDVEVLDVKPTDAAILSTLKNAQMRAVQTAITLTADEQNLEATRRRLAIQDELGALEANAALGKEVLEQEKAKAKAETTLLELVSAAAQAAQRGEAELADQELRGKLSSAELAIRAAADAQTLLMEQERAKLFAERFKAITPDLVAAMNAVGDKLFMERLSAALAPLALAEQNGLGQTIERVFKDTPLAPVIDAVKARGKRAQEPVGV